MKILIVDDNADNIEMMLIMLKSQKYDVVSARNGKEALDLLKNEEISLIISDILMPVMDGFQLCRECKKDERLRNICFVFYTATYIDEKDEEFALSIGAQKFMRKPQEPDEFIKNIKCIIEKCELGNFEVKKPEVDNDSEVFQIYSERLVHKLEKKNLDLEKEIAEHKITEAKLKESEERFALAVEGTQDGIWDWNLHTDACYFSDRYAKMLGYEPEEMGVTNDTWRNLLHPDDKEKALKNSDDYLNKKVDIYESIFRMKAKDDSYRWINARGKALFDEEGKPYRFVGFHRDITDKKQQEIELIKAKEKAEESDRLKTAFLANLSHEIRTPMNGIKGFINIVKKSNLDTLEQEQYLGIIEKSSNQLLNIMTDLIKISKLDSNQIHVNNTAVNILLVINQIYAQFYQNMQTSKNVSIKAAIHPSIIDLYCITDEDKLSQILIKLIQNAIKFTPMGNIEIGCELNNKNEIEFYVKDSGIGIAKENQELIFQNFRQVETSFSLLPGGTGLGLSISKGYIELLGGRIWLDSEPKKGSIFRFTIPYIPASKND